MDKDDIWNETNQVHYAKTWSPPLIVMPSRADGSAPGDVRPWVLPALLLAIIGLIALTILQVIP